MWSVSRRIVAFHTLFYECFLSNENYDQWFSRKIAKSSENSQVRLYEARLVINLEVLTEKYAWYQKS